MNLDYVFGPVKATDNLLNIQLEFVRVQDTQPDDFQGTQRGWAWTSDEESLDIVGECSGGLYDIDPIVAIDDMLAALRAELVDRLDAWLEKHPKAATDLEKYRDNPSQYFKDREEAAAK
jgi:hypothetical protein